MNLRVVIPFANYAIGALITDPATIAAITASDAHRFVVRVAAPPAPTPVPLPAMTATPAPAPATQPTA